MKIGIILIVLALGTATASAQVYDTFGHRNSYGSYGSSGLSGTGSNSNNHYVSPHTNSNGGYIGGHHQTNQNNTQLDNYGTRGNVNPYTGQVGTRTPRY